MLRGWLDPTCHNFNARTGWQLTCNLNKKFTNIGKMKNNQVLNVGNRSWTTSGSKLAGIFVRYSNFGRKIGQYSELLDAMKVSILLLNNGTWDGFLLKPMLFACSFHKIWFRIIKYIQRKSLWMHSGRIIFALTLILKSKMLTRTMYCQNTKYLLISYLRKRSKFRTQLP